MKHQPINASTGFGKYPQGDREKWLLSRGETTQRPQPISQSLLEKAGNYIEATGRHFAGGCVTRSKKEVEKLLQICRSCPSGQYDEAKKICKKCGCRVNESGSGFKNKLASKTSSCPLDHW